MFVLSFIKEVRGEFNNIVWPTRAEAMRLSLIVVLVSIFVGLFVGGLDFAFTNLLNTIVSKQ